MLSKLSLILALLVAIIMGCREESPSSGARAAADSACRAKWGKGLDELPTVELVLMTANNEDILREFGETFSLEHAVEYGQQVRLEKNDPGGGGSAMEKALLNTFVRLKDGSVKNPGLDVVWGGGDPLFAKLASDLPRTGPLLAKLELDADILANVPPQHGGVRMRDPQLLWIGSVVSGFGFIYNDGMLRRRGIEPPATWDDLAEARFIDSIMLADPLQSGSAAAAYRMIVLSSPDWPSGWSKLLAVLGNVKRITGGAGEAANAPMLGEALVATAIDFYGVNRTSEAPTEVMFVLPEGGTAYTPDPIGVLVNAPHPELAQRFVRFVLSRHGQALWALPVGAADGPRRNKLARTPIRRDVYTHYAGKLLPGITDPFEKSAIVMSPQKAAINYNVLRQLVGAAATNNRSGLSAAKRAIDAAPSRHDMLAEFNALPPNVATLELMAQTANDLYDKARADDIIYGWQLFFRDKFNRIVAMSGEAAK